MGKTTGCRTLNADGWGDKKAAGLKEVTEGEHTNDTNSYGGKL